MRFERKRDWFANESTGFGRLAQLVQSVRLTRVRSLVRSQQRPQRNADFGMYAFGVPSILDGIDCGLNKSKQSAFDPPERPSLNDGVQSGGKSEIPLFFLT